MLGRDGIRWPTLLLGLIFASYCVVLHYQLRVYWPAEEKLADVTVEAEANAANYRRVLNDLTVCRRQASEPRPCESTAEIALAASQCLQQKTELQQRIDALERQLRESQAAGGKLHDRALHAENELAVAARVAEPEPDFTVFVMALTAPTADAAQRRMAMRRTWLTYRRPGGKPDSVRHRFVIGTAGLSASSRAELDIEQRTHGDLALLPHFKEAFQNLTGKLLEGFAWSVNESNIGRFAFLMKVDDDTFVRMDKVEQELVDVAPVDRNRLYWGYFDGRAEVRRRGKYAEMEWIMCDRYLPYALGGGYVVSRALAAYIAANQHSFARFNAEDASLGLWLAPLNITRKHDTRFDTEWRPRGCYDRYVVLHKRSAEEMETKHSRLVNTSFKVQCPSEYRNKGRSEYVYNWSVLPSNCCPGRGKH
eukprot:m.76335 g.76335  ORF g.76335 m.76335 type:complete len:422 (-) comp10518_c0_seq1:626-1891(-)